MKQKISIALCFLTLALTASALTRYLPTVLVPNTPQSTNQQSNVLCTNTIAASGYEAFPLTNVVTVTNAGSISSLTNYVTNITTGVITAQQQQNLAINVSFQVLNAQSTNHGSVVFTFVPSVDNVLFDTENLNPYFQFTVTPTAAAGSTNISFTTNWGDSVMGAIGYFQLAAITNNFTNNVITNIQVQYSGKTANTSGY